MKGVGAWVMSSRFTSPSVPFTFSFSFWASETQLTGERSSHSAGSWKGYCICWSQSIPRSVERVEPIQCWFLYLGLVAGCVEEVNVNEINGSRAARKKREDPRSLPRTEPISHERMCVCVESCNESERGRAHNNFPLKLAFFSPYKTAQCRRVVEIELKKGAR